MFFFLRYLFSFQRYSRFVLCKLDNWWRHECFQYGVKTQKNNISANIKAMLFKLGTSIVPEGMHHKMHISMLLWQHSCFQTSFMQNYNSRFYLSQASSAFKTFRGRNSAISTFYIFRTRRSFLVWGSQMVIFLSKRRENWKRGCCHSDIKICIMWCIR